MTMPIIPVAHLTEQDRNLLTSYYRHWNIIPRNMECVGVTNGKPVFRPVPKITEGQGG